MYTSLSHCPHTNSIADFTHDDIISRTECQICGVSGPNLWVCISRECHLFTGCGEGSRDHSTEHYKLYPTHRLTLNSTTFRVWCYACETEVFVENNCVGEEIDRKTRKLSESSVYYANATDEETTDDEESLIDSNGKPRGLTGLQNLGNTCYMNAALQALSNCPPLTRFMLDCQTYIRKTGLAKSYCRLIKEVWDPRRPSYVVPSGIAHGIKNVCPVFRGYSQQDAQEFLRCFLDQLHEELKEAHSGDVNCYSHVSSNALTCEDIPLLNDMSDADSDDDYRTCDSGLSSEKSTFGDDFANINDDEMLDAGTINLNSSQNLSIPSVPPPSASPSLMSSNQMPIGQSQSSPRKSEKRKSVSYRSIISDIFDGRLLSSVQCLKCDNVSTTKETFQDLSLPIPNRDQIYMLRVNSQNAAKGDSSVTASLNSMTGSSANITQLANNMTNMYTWIWELIDWVTGWIWGPAVSLQDCLSAFFSADELKGDNMYSCEKCRKLRNGVKYSKVLQLPEILSIHLKRFRHELMYSAKISSHVTFPLEGLDMSPYTARNAPNQVTTYDLVAVICHHGTAASGHYTAYALNQLNDVWYEFDDQYVTSVEPHQVANCEAYVLFYRKSNEDMEKRRLRALDLIKLSRSEPSLLQFYVSKQWVNRFNTFADPGPITNSDFLCDHGGVEPDKAHYIYELCIVFSRAVWEYLHSTFGGGPTCTKLYVCQTCSSEKETLDRRRKYEYETFTRLNSAFINQRTPVIVYCISMAWFKQWESFVTGKTNDPPGHILNSSICNTKAHGAAERLKIGSDFASISEEMWTFLHSIYGGGPHVSHHSHRKMSSSYVSQPQKQSEQIKEAHQFEVQQSQALDDNVESTSVAEYGKELSFVEEHEKSDIKQESAMDSHSITSQECGINEHAND